MNASDREWFVRRVGGCHCLALGTLLRQKAVRKNGDDHDARDQNLLFPPSVVAQVLLPSAIRHVLECTCNACGGVADRITLTDGDMIDAVTLEGRDGDRSRRQFAALVWIGAGFSARYIHFTSMRPALTQDQIRADLFETPVRQAFPIPAEAATKFEALFDYAKRLFESPTIELSLSHQDLSGNNLPFIYERPLRSSSETVFHSRLFEFEIQPEFRGESLTRENAPANLVRKELPWDSTENERTTLKFLAKCGKPNLIKLLFYYRYGDRLNLVFRRYPCSLEDILNGDKERPDAAAEPTRYEKSILRHWLWQGMVDVVAALKFFHDPEAVNHSLEAPIIAAHFDLKPANILVDKSGDLIVADFGEARIKLRQLELTTAMTRGAGTTPYRPPDQPPNQLEGFAGGSIDPEAANSDRRWSRAYDTWSIACVMMEVIEYIMTGPDGFKKFRISRHADDSGSHMVSTSFWRAKPDGKPELKKSVRDKLSFIRSGLTAKVDRYLSSVADLLERMFAMDAEQRPNMAECLSILTQNFPSDDWPLLDDNEEPICGLGTKRPLRSMRTEFCRRKHDKERCKMYLNMNSTTGRVRLVVEFDNESGKVLVISDSARIAEERFNPESLFNIKYNPYQKPLSCSFQTVYPTAEFIFEVPRDYYTFLTAVTKHQPLRPFHHMPISSCVVKPKGYGSREPYGYGHVQIWKQLSQEQFSDQFSESAATIERRSSDVSAASHTTTLNRRDSGFSSTAYAAGATHGAAQRQSGSEDIPPHRLVIMIAEGAQNQRRYITLDLARRAHTINLGFTAKGVPERSSVTLTTFKDNLVIGNFYDEKGGCPGFPLEPETLLHRERQKVEWVELTFSNIDARQNFERLYTDLTL